MNTYKDKIHNYIDMHKDEIISCLTELVKIPSVREEAEENAPFGRACADVLLHTQKLYEENGFETELDENGGYLLSYYGKGDKSLGIFAHADVVPVSDDWTFTEPFTPLLKDGFLFGRGVKDDKAAVVFGIYIAKMLKELDIPFKHRLVCFTGSNEESGMEDMQNYVKKHTPPDFSLVCDTGFPLHRGCKSIFRFVLTSNEKLNDITDFNGGESFNIILGKATAKVKYSEELYSYLKLNALDQIHISKENDEIIISSKGISKHAALPEGSLNAGYIIADVLRRCDKLTPCDQSQMSMVSKLLSDYYGEVFKIECEDKNFGKLTCSNGIIKMNDGKISLSFDVRFGIEKDVEMLKKAVDVWCNNNGWSAEYVTESKGYITDARNPMLVACLDTFKEFTGRYDAVPYINAGGTYGKYLPCAIETGLDVCRGGWRERTFTLPEGHGGVHQPDEFIDTEAMLDALELTMLMILACDNEEN